VGKQWLLIGPLLALLLSLLFALGTAALNSIGLAELSRVLPLLPAILLFAAINGFGEELIYRAAPLSQLGPVVGNKQAIWLTAVWFGLGHYAGSDLGGMGYAIIAGALALLFGKAMVETRGIVLPMFMHMLIDIVIFTFIALAAQRG
jgi:membrane protease YdiL (CAAX protease family)